MIASVGLIAPGVRDTEPPPFTRPARATACIGDLLPSRSGAPRCEIGSAGLAAGGGASSHLGAIPLTGLPWQATRWINFGGSNRPVGCSHLAEGFLPRGCGLRSSSCKVSVSSDTKSGSSRNAARGGTGRAGAACARRDVDPPWLWLSRRRRRLGAWYGVPDGRSLRTPRGAERRSHHLRGRWRRGLSGSTGSPRAALNWKPRRRICIPETSLKRSCSYRSGLMNGLGGVQ